MAAQRLLNVAILPLMWLKFLSVRHASWLLAFGLLVVLQQLLAGLCLMQSAPSTGAAAVVEICSGQGLVKAIPTPVNGEPAQHGASEHACCTLCGTSSPLLVADFMAGIPPVPALVASPAYPTPARARPASWAAPPVRGPPALL